MTGGERAVPAGDQPARDVWRGGALRSRALRSRWSLFVPASRYQAILLSSIAAGLLVWPFASGSLWLDVGLMLSVFVVLHSLYAARAVPWIPGAIAAIACLQWIVVPWLTYLLQDVTLVQRMPLPPEQYFAYLTPATLALVAGMYLPVVRAGRTRPPQPVEPRAAPPSFLRTCDLMVIGGVLARAVLMVGIPAALKQPLVLVARCSYVGAFALMLAGARNWWQRVAIVFAVEAFLSAADAQFADLVVWGIYFALLLAYRFRPRTRTVLALTGGAAAFIVALNGIKYGYRQTLAAGDVSVGDRPAIVGRSVFQLLRNPDLLLSPANLAFNLSRLNQGALTARVLIWTPAMEPFAGGETVVQAFRDAIVPRILDPGKRFAGGFDNFPRFTGLPLIGGTSANLSIPGEMYANFGPLGGVLGTFGYGLAIGLVFRWFTRRARRSVFWWAWAPFILLSTMSAESGLAESAGQIVKSTVIMAAVLSVSPDWAALRRLSRRRRRAAAPSYAAVPGGGAP